VIQLPSIVGQLRRVTQISLGRGFAPSGTVLEQASALQSAPHGAKHGTNGRRGRCSRNWHRPCHEAVKPIAQTVAINDGGGTRWGRGAWIWRSRDCRRAFVPARCCTAAMRTSSSMPTWHCSASGQTREVFSTTCFCWASDRAAVRTCCARSPRPTMHAGAASSSSTTWRPTTSSGPRTMTAPG
jgi:hypothetical protein